MYRQTVTLCVVMVMGLTEWIVAELNPEKNALFWLAGTFGAFAIRFGLPRMKWGRSLSGWLLGTLFAFFISPSAVEWDWLVKILSKPISIWFLMGMTGDVFVLIFGWIRGKTAENPEKAFDTGLSASKKIYDTFGGPAGEFWGGLLKSILSAFKKPDS